jgi:hypothetical protein
VGQNGGLTRRGSSTHAGPVKVTEELGTTVHASAATALTGAGGTSAARYGSVRNHVADLPSGARSLPWWFGKSLLWKHAVSRDNHRIAPPAVYIVICCRCD